MSHIFISYSRKDITFAKQVVSALEKSEFDVWIDWDNIPKGEDWWSEIQSGVEEADAFLFLLSPDSAASEVCRDELEHALENGKRILPVVLRDISPQDTHSELSKRNWIFCRDGQDNFNQAITEIIDTIHIDYEWLKFHAELQVKALKWQRNNQEKSLLLRGQELEEAEKIVNIKSGTEPQLVDIQRKYLWESRQAANRQRRNITVGTITIALAIIGIILFSYFLVRDERDRALANQVAAVSKNYLEEKLDLALLLAVQASRQDENFQTNDALLLSIQQDPNTLQVMRGHGGIVLSVAFSPDGTRIASGSSDNTIRIWDANSGEQIGEPLTGHSWSVNSVAFSPDGTRIASGSSDNTIRIWDANSGEQIGKPLTEHINGVSSVAFSPDGTRIVSGSDDYTIRIWDANSGEQIGKTLTGHSGYVSSVAFSPDGAHIASGSSDNTIRIWDANSGEQIGEPFTGHINGVTSLAFSPDGAHIASGSKDNTIRIWDANSGEQIGEPLTGHSGSVNSVAFNPDGTRIASGSSDNTIRIWDANSGEQIGELLTGHINGVTSVAFSPDGTRIVSGSFDKTLRIWDTNSGKQIGEPLTGHSGSVSSVAFSPDGKHIVSAGGYGDQTIRFWDAFASQQIGEPIALNHKAWTLSISVSGLHYSGHSGDILSVAFSTDGTMIASGSSDTTIRFWDMDIESWIAKACQRAGRNLTLQEWNTYYSESIPYEATCPQWPIPEDAQAYLDARALQQKQILTGVVGVLILAGLYLILRRRRIMKKG